jgi:hypothetical protein
MDVEKLNEVVNPLKGLATVVDSHLEELRIAEALEAIISQLKTVRPDFI